jgi:hypothetical protein
MPVSCLWFPVIIDPIAVDTDRKLTRKGLLYRLKIDQVIHVSCLIFRHENLRGDYHGYVCKDTADVLP